ncbi:hypothetical protein ED733_000171 [Metarhizium rileyi]|uniref:Protein kinase domain-containing protein n=1 Tax=Metarhizium rileyi (strain RCEF 4871) TaxID=1649241 RepID=A0A5C6FZU9_METRR|nr:hypothetical protein ED733_000171 [Metarhizium rileyi]
MVSPKTQKFKIKDVVAAVTELRIGRNAPFFAGEFIGGECRIFKLGYEDEASVAVRVRHPTDDSSRDDTIAIVKAEIRLLQTLEAKGFRWAPTYRGASLTFENPIEHPFIVLTWIEGSALSWDENLPSQPLRDALLQQIASIQLSLITDTMENRGRTQVREGKIPGVSEQDCGDQQALLDAVLGQDRNCTVFAMDHGDIKPGNIIVDEKYNITWYVKNMAAVRNAKDELLDIRDPAVVMSTRGRPRLNADNKKLKVPRYLKIADYTS